MQSMKDTAANIAASAKAGMEKTKATVQEKVEKMKANDPIEKEMATERKEERIEQAEINKREARGGQHPSHTSTGTGGAYTESGPGSGYGTTGTGNRTASYSTSGAYGYPTGAQQMSALPGHGTGQPTGQVIEGVAVSHPIGINSGTGHNPSHNTHVEGTGGPTYGTGGCN
ncbi:hypothetical protein ACOSQ3_029126 [Xanthoceras sorbifolium]